MGLQSDSQSRKGQLHILNIPSIIYNWPHKFLGGGWLCDPVGLVQTHFGPPARNGKKRLKTGFGLTREMGKEWPRNGKMPAFSGGPEIPFRPFFAISGQNPEMGLYQPNGITMHVTIRLHTSLASMSRKARLTATKVGGAACSDSLLELSRILSFLFSFSF